MKKLKVYLILVCLFYTNICFAQSGWFWQNPIPQGNNLTSVLSFNTELIYAFGDAGTFIKTTNAGLNWELKNFIGGFGSEGYSRRLSASFFLNSSTGFVTTANSFINDDSRILKTTNSGFTWDTVTTSTFPSFNTIFFIDEITGWSCCSFSGYMSDINRVLKTTNSGLNWFIQNSSINSIYSMYFINSNTGWFTGHYQLPYPASSSAFYIYKTTDGGSTFFIQLSNNGSQQMKSVYFINENTGWVGGTNIWKTTDGGSTWSSQNVNANVIVFVNSQTGYCANNSNILKTTNAGANWIVQSNGTGGNSISLLNNENVIAAGFNGRISRTTNGGNNWHIISQSITSNPITSVRFLNDNTGFCIYHYWSYPPYPGTVLKTTDKGVHWLVNFENTLHDLNDIFFIDDVTGWISGDVGILYKTTNAGINWFAQNSNTAEDLGKIHFMNQNTGWILCDAAKLLKTTNGGLIWNQLNVSTIYRHDMVFLNENTGIIVGNSGIAKTTDGGLNWQNVLSSTMYKIDVDNLNNVYVISFSGFYKSTDLGTSWHLISTTNNACVDIEMLNSSTGYISCGRGKVLKTIDGGMNWLLINLPTNGELRSIFAIDTNQCWVTGDYGLIMSTVGQGIITGINNQNAGTIRLDFSLFQNYPNPFNPQTKIKFDIPSNVKGQTSNVKLVIYDLLGREVTTLVNEELKPGTYEADWDGSNYSSGVYFYKLTAGNFIETKKMVLMK